MSQLQLLDPTRDWTLFWNMFDTYMNELAKAATHGDGVDLEYFCSDDYKDAVIEISQRVENPIRINFIIEKEKIVGFAMCQFMFDEGDTCTLMEFYLVDKIRNKGLGKTIYTELEDYINKSGLKHLELTSTNDINQRFWESVGYTASDEVDEDNKIIFRKKL